MTTEGVGPNFKKICCFVLTVHAIALWYFIREPISIHQPTFRSKVVVKTISLEPKTEVPRKKEASVSNPTVHHSVPSKAKEQTASKKTEKNHASKQATPATKSSAKPSVQQTQNPVKQQAALAKARDALAGLKADSHAYKAESSKTLASELSLPTLTASPLPEKASTLIEVSYQDDLILRLQTVLRLPEYGNVKVSLTLDRSGRVDAFKVLDSRSAANKKYVEEHLPRCKFADFGKHFPSENQHVFVLTLSND
jgi:colicin import membrane protein